MKFAMIFAAGFSLSAAFAASAVMDVGVTEVETPPEVISVTGSAAPYGAMRDG
ncbi:hypothetical protein IV417_04690 [Alphaproteobacteria bacterium KMM 3653]|uniref:Uncharacterized protein n=1 Tax=Harenicola maris TaxID=2841044 RepID=A0AAP2CP38_9RHOB|nr:hypothetical protein [Harenicola maris]